MMASAFCFHDGIRFFVADETSGHGQHIGIVVLARKGSQFGLPAEGATHALVLVQGHADALSAAADSDAGIAFACLYGLAHRVGKVGIVATLFGVGPEILVSQSFGFEPLLDVLLQRESGVIRAKSYGFHCFSLSKLFTLNRNLIARR